NRLAMFYLARDRHAEAEAELRRALLLTPDNAALYVNLGVVYVRAGNDDGAREMFERSVALGPTYPAYTNLGTLYLHAGRYRDAMNACEQALRINDRDYRVW